MPRLHFHPVRDLACLDRRVGRVPHPALLALAFGAAHLAAQTAVQWVDKPLQRPTAYAATVYDTARGRAVLFGGIQGTAAWHNSSETWEWDGVRWVFREPTTRPPIALLPSGKRTPVAYDVRRQRAVLLTSPNGASVDTWEW